MPLSLQILGVIVLAIGIWAVVAESDFSFITGNEIASGAALLIVSGIVTIIICLVGIFGGIFKARPLLVVVSEGGREGGREGGGEEGENEIPFSS